MKNWLTIVTFVLLLTFGVVWVVSHGEDQSSSEAGPSKATEIKRPRLAPNVRFLPQIEAICDPSLHWEERVRAVRELPDKLDKPTTDRLFAFLQEPPATGEEKWYLVCNEIMEVLRKRNLVPDVYTKNLLTLIQSSTADPTIRDYAAQHLAQWVSGIDPSACEKDPRQAAAAFEAMCREASNPANGQLTLAGTTLNALADAVTHGGPTVQQERAAVGRLALRMVDSPAGVFSNVNRSTALQVAARLQMPEVPQRSRMLALDTNTPADVRLSAIAALGLVGDAEDRALLYSFVSDEAFKFAAAAAVERVDQRAARP